MSEEILDLDLDVELSEDGEGILAAQGRVELMEAADGLISIEEPAGDGGDIPGPIGIQEGTYGSAIGVAANDDFGDLKDGGGVFDAGGDADEVIAVDGDDVAGIPFDEEFAGGGGGDEAGDDAGIGAGEEEGLGGLAFGEAAEEGLFGGEDMIAKVADTVAELMHDSIIGERKRKAEKALATTELWVYTGVG